MLTAADFAGLLGLAIFAAGLAATMTVPRRLVARPAGAALYVGGLALWGLALFAAWYAWSVPARSCAACQEPLALAVNEALGPDPFAGFEADEARPW